MFDQISLNRDNSHHSSPPAPPADLVATPAYVANCPTCGMPMAHINLAWDNVSGAKTYLVCRNGVSVATSINSPHWTDMGVWSGQTYTYTVRAVGPGGDSAPSTPATATAPTPPNNQTQLTSPINLCIQGTWQGGPTDVLSWAPVTGAASYNIYQYDTLIGKGITVPTFTVPTSIYWPQMTYTVTAVDSTGMETIPSALTTAQGSFDPGNQPGFLPPLPLTPISSWVVAEWNLGSPRMHLAWRGDLHNYLYNVYRDGTLIATGLWGLNYYDTAVQPGETHSYTVSGTNVYWTKSVESAQSVPVTGTALLADPTPSTPGTVQITNVQPDDDSVLVSFTPVAGAVDYRLYDLANPNTKKYSAGGLSIELNGLDPTVSHTLVVEAVNKFGPFQTMDGMAGPGAMMMDGMHSAINGQGDPSNVPNVLAVSAPTPVTCVPTTLTGSQVFFDNFRQEQPLIARPLPTPIPGDGGEAYGYANNMTVVANDKWEIRNSTGDLLNSTTFFMGNHFMDTLYDGATARVSNVMHNNNASMVLMPKATANIAGGQVLHVTFEVDAHMGGRRWCDVVVTAAGDPFINPGKLDGGLSPTVSGNMFRWSIQNFFHFPELFLGNAETFLVNTQNGVNLDNPQVQRSINSGITTLMNGSPQDLDKRHRFDLYLSQTHFRIFEQGQLVKDSDFPLDASGKIQSLPFDKCQVYFVHQVYHTGNDRPEQVTYYPESCYWYNYRPWSDERHWDNMGFEVLPSFPAMP